MSKIDWIELIAFTICLTFVIAISLYHLSFDGYLSLSLANWNTVYAISENGLSMAMGAIIAVFAYGAIKLIFKYLFVPYFGFKLIYHFSIYSGVYFFHPTVWEYIWSILMIVVIIVGCLILILTRHV